MIDIQMNRRTFIMTTAAVAAGALFTPERPAAESRAAIQRVIPSSGERLPVIGMGTSGTFDVGSDPEVRAGLAEVLKSFFDNGGTVIDTSPMYGKAEAVVGELLKAMHYRGPLFAATKVWIDGKNPGIEQMQMSMRLMGVDVMDLMQIHNLRDWKTHLPTLRQWKEQGRIRYIGITTSHGRSHSELEQLMLTEVLDFVQFSYSLDDRSGGKTPAAPGRGQGHRHPDQPALRARRYVPQSKRKAAAGMERRVRLPDLGAIFPEVHSIAPGGHLCDSGHGQAELTCRTTWEPVSAGYPMRVCVKKCSNIMIRSNPEG